MYSEDGLSSGGEFCDDNVEFHCPILSYIVLYCPVLSCIVLYCPISSYIVLYCPILSYIVLYCCTMLYVDGMYSEDGLSSGGEFYDDNVEFRCPVLSYIVLYCPVILYYVVQTVCTVKMVYRLVVNSMMIMSSFVDLLLTSSSNLFLLYLHSRPVIPFFVTIINYTV